MQLPLLLVLLPNVEHCLASLVDIHSNGIHPREGLDLLKNRHCDTGDFTFNQYSVV